LQSDIQDERENATQFCVIKPELSQNSDSNRFATLAFSTQKDIPGSLLNVLSIFQQHHINLTKI
jgi:Prephenate dehydratase